MIKREGKYYDRLWNDGDIFADFLWIILLSRNGMEGG